MFLLLVSAVFLATSHAAKPCCIERQFEVEMGEIGGAVYAGQNHPTHTLMNVQNIVHFDFYGRKMAIEAHVHTPNGTDILTDIVIDYSTKLLYTTPKGGPCIKSPNVFAITPFAEPCIPVTAQLVDESYLGFGIDKIPFTTWQYIPSGSSQIVRMSVTNENCIPIMESAFGTLLKGSTDVLFIMTNFRSGIKSMSVFDIPTNCTDGPSPGQIGTSPHDTDIHRRAIEKASRIIRAFDRY